MQSTTVPRIRSFFLAGFVASAAAASLACSAAGDLDDEADVGSAESADSVGRGGGPGRPGGGPGHGPGRPGTGPGNGPGTGPGNGPGTGPGNGPGGGRGGNGPPGRPTRGHFRGAELRNLGGACKFDDDENGAADSFVLANGQDVSIVFTKLGESTKLGPRGRRLVSRCNFSIPIDVPEGAFVSGWNQSLTYGVVKPAGVAAGLGLDANLKASAGAQMPLPGIEVVFPRATAVDLALQTATPRGALESNSIAYLNLKMRWCAARRDADLQFVGSAYTWTERDANNTPVIIAIDGVDARFDLGAVLDTCPPPSTVPTRPVPNGPSRR